MAVSANADEPATSAGLLATIAQYLILAHGVARQQFTRVTNWVINLHNWHARRGGKPELPRATARMSIMQQVRMIGGAVVGIAVITLVVNEVLTINAINNSSGPFSGVITSLENTGVAAMTLLVVGLVVVAASAIMRFMGSGF